MPDLRLKPILALLALILAMPVVAATREENRVADAADVLDQFLRIPEKSIPPSLLARAYAVAVIPDVIKAGFVLGARRGKGIIVVRQDDNSWSNPAFIALTGGSFGWQAGVGSTDIILVFKTRNGVENIKNGKLTLGADASVSAGPVGRTAGVATDLAFEAEVMSYSRSRGLFAGVSLEGSAVTMDRDANSRFYHSTSMSPEKIFASSPNIAPDIANTFVQILTAQTRRLPTTPGMQSGTSNAPQVPVEEQAEVRTFGMPDPEE
ncbi:MAG: lipid-binding SYLF domain-containing protein [Proteobacteria bacterium]|nr:lipid-binding SYLF domain-containing protein [Pseudomonadota bacterium]MDA1064187.1 lipid-binding SYLF domain-containing protein [Pseudomonadota bacterium]